jgi:septal ring factor EnvC (AmiA/AmiB activator)
MEHELTYILFGVTCTLIGIIYTTINSKITKIETRSDDHEKRIQKTEDLHGDRLEKVEKKIDKLETTIQTLADNLHKEKNEEYSLTIAITKLYQFLENYEKSN